MKYIKLVKKVIYNYHHKIKSKIPISTTTIPATDDNKLVPMGRFRAALRNRRTKNNET